MCIIFSENVQKRLLTLHNACDIISIKRGQSHRWAAPNLYFIAMKNMKKEKCNAAAMKPAFLLNAAEWRSDL